MTQYIESKVKFAVPDDFIVIDRKEYERLANQERDEPIYAEKDWLRAKTGFKSETSIYEKLLDPFRDELDINNGGPIHYSERQGDKLIVIKKPFNEWLEKNYQRVYGS